MQFENLFSPAFEVREDECFSNAADNNFCEIDDLLDGHAHDGMSIANLGILAKLKNLLNLNRSERKRSRSEDENVEYTTLRKYRRLDSEFPRLIRKPFEDDLTFLQSQQHTSRIPMANPQRKSIDNRMKYRFMKPKFTTKRVTNSAFADIEFSDDEDDDDVVVTENGIPVPSGLFGSNAAGSFRSNENIRPPPKIVNIPIKTADHKMIPHLYEPKTGNLVTKPTLPNLHPIRSNISGISQDAFANGFGSSARSTPVFNGYHHNRLGGNTSSNRSFLPHNNSIISQQNQTLEKNTYAELLRKVAPNLYEVPALKPVHRSLLNSSGAGRRSINVSQQSQSQADRRRSRNLVDSAIPVITLDDDEPQVIDLVDDETNILAAYAKLNRGAELFKNDKKEEVKPKELSYVEPVNSLKDRLGLVPVGNPEWFQQFRSKWSRQHEENRKEIKEAEAELRKMENETAKAEKIINERIKSMQLFDPEIVVIDEFPEPIEDEEEEDELPELSKQDEDLINRAIYTGSSDNVICNKFNMNITRRDINSLNGNTWLNDEVINFYMNLLTERGDLRHSEGLPRVYAMNTFFIPRLMQSGHGGVRRWTRKVDIFSYDVLPVPVHVGGVHWCMAIIHLKEKTIKYYDSMGTPNPKVLAALENYLKEESMDKRKQPFDTSEFEKESVADCPRQMNGSDCGVFSCMFAEYISRDRPITFTQEQMPYFRRKMILEIIRGKLLQ